MEIFNWHNMITNDKILNLNIWFHMKIMCFNVFYTVKPHFICMHSLMDLIFVHNSKSGSIELFNMMVAFGLYWKSKLQIN
jgi:hypothetical protein